MKLDTRAKRLGDLEAKDSPPDPLIVSMDWPDSFEAQDELPEPGAIAIKWPEEALAEAEAEARARAREKA